MTTETSHDTATPVLPLVWATKENLAGYGQLLGGEDVPNAGLSIPFYKGSVIEGGNIDFQYTGKAVIRLARILPGGRAEVRWLERHLRMTQLFLPLGLEPFVMVLAPPTHEEGGMLPELDRVTAFAIPPGHGLLLKIGTWHDFPVAPRGPITVLTMNSDEVVEALRLMKEPGEMDGGDVYKLDIPARMGVRMQLDLTLPGQLMGAIAPATAPPSFGYERPSSLQEAVALLCAPGARAYAGGTDLLPALGGASGEGPRLSLLVDVKALAETHGVEHTRAGLRIGATTTAATLTADQGVRAFAPALVQAAAATAAPAIRRRATVGGNLCTPHAAGDMAAALLALDAQVEIAGPQGTRRAGVDAFLSASPRLHPGELLLAVLLPAPAPGAFQKFGPRLGFCRAIVSAAVCVHDGSPRIALGGVGARPVRPLEVERALAGGLPLEPALSLDCDPPDDAIASRAYRLRLAVVLIRRCAAACGATLDAKEVNSA